MKSVRQLSIAILIVTALVAFVFGFMLIADGTGHTLQLSLDDLKGTFFNDYSTPGWILAIAIGGFAALAAVITILHNKLYPKFILAEAVLLVLFIIAEFYFIQQFLLSQIFFGLAAIALFLLGNLLRKNLLVHSPHSGQIGADKHDHKKSHHHKHRKRGH